MTSIYLSGSPNLFRATHHDSKMLDRFILQDISRISQSMRLSKTPKHRRHSHDDVLTRFPPQLIPSATIIYPRLQEIGLPHEQAEEISNAYLKSCNELRSMCDISLRNAVSSMEGPVTTDTVANMIQMWSTAHSKQTAVWAESAFSRAREFTENAPSRIIKKSTFNHVRNPVHTYNLIDLCTQEYTPLLEKYFEYNAYPSAPDRAVLARKSMMTPRQIEVWV